MKKLISSAAAFLMLTAGCAARQQEGVATAGGVQQSADPDRPSDNADERVRQFVSCMRANGVDVPDPEPDDRTGKTALRFDNATDAADKQRIVAAMEKCSKYFPAGGEDIRLTPEQLEGARRFAQCMRENGVPNWPDPEADGNFKTDNLTAIKKDDPAVLAGLEKCRAA